jgi:sporulation integral membrane protein YtvI
VFLGGGYLAVRLFVKPLLPFLLAFLFALLLEPAVVWCQQRLGFQRKFAAAALSALVMLAALVLIFLLCGKLLRQGQEMMRYIPQLLRTLPDALERVEQRWQGFYRACPAEVRIWLDNTADRIAEEGLSLTGELSAALIGKVSLWMGQMPRLLLFLFTTLLAVYFTTASFPEIVSFFRRQFPKQWQWKMQGMADCLRRTFWKWLGAEGVLCGVTFLLLLLGFLYLKQDYGFLLAVLIALVDALPVLGAGLFLVPWALGHLLLGSVPRGVALLALYAVILLVRSILEPKLMAAQAGLPPLSALLAMYVGYSLFGVGGMLLLPVVLLFCRQLSAGGYFSL